MKRSLAIMATTAALALSLAACGADGNNNVDLLPDMDGAETSDTLTNGNGAADTQNGGTGTVTGSMNRGAARYDAGTNNGSRNSIGTDTLTGSGGSGSGTNYAGVNGNGMNGSGYTAMNNGGLMAKNGGAYSMNTGNAGSTAANTRYARMLANGRVHDRDGFLLDGENAHYNTF